MNYYTEARKHMLASQLVTNQVLSLPVLRALEIVPRETFLPEHLSAIAYVDEDIMLDNGRFLMEPLAAARFLQAAAIQPNQRVLVIGGAPGYLPALAACFSPHIISLEASEAEAKDVKSRIKALSPTPVQTKSGSLASGLAEETPFDVILIPSAIHAPPEKLTGQIKEGGKIITVLRPYSHAPGKLVLFSRRHGMLCMRDMGDVNIPMLPEWRPTPSFHF